MAEVNKMGHTKKEENKKLGKDPVRVVRGKVNYDAGNAFEEKVVKKMRNSNCKQVIHSKGSFGLFDIWGLTRDGRIRLVTCKINGYLSPKERNALIDYMENEQSENEVIELWYYNNKKHMRKTTITLDKLRD